MAHTDEQNRLLVMILLSLLLLFFVVVASLFTAGMCSRERDALVYGDAVCCYSFLPPPYTHTHTLHTTTIVLSLPALHTCRRKSSSFAVARALIGLPLPDCGIGTRSGLASGVDRTRTRPARQKRSPLSPPVPGR